MVELSNHQVQDILDDMGMIDENGNCPYTAEEIFKAGVEFAEKKIVEKCWRWVTENFYEDYSEDNKSYVGSMFKNGEEMLKDFNKTMKRE